MDEVSAVAKERWRSERVEGELTSSPLLTSSARSANGSKNRTTLGSLSGQGKCDAGAATDGRDGADWEDEAEAEGGREGRAGGGRACEPDATGRWGTTGDWDLLVLT